MRTWRRMFVALVVAVPLLAASGALAVPIVQYSATDLGGGLFEYQLTVVNDDGSEGLSGLNVLHGGSVFGLDGSSVIGAPSGWQFFEPLPPLIDDLNYFSLSPGDDIPVDGTLGGFSFRSTTDPDTLAPGDFEVEGIGSDSATQIPLGDALPEPLSGLLLAVALALGARRAWG